MCLYCEKHSPRQSLKKKNVSLFCTVDKPLDPAKAIRHEDKRTEPSKFDAVATYACKL